jgi:hypothetical protein
VVPLGVRWVVESPVVLTRWARRSKGPRLSRSVPPCGWGMVWSMSQRAAGVVEPGNAENAFSGEQVVGECLGWSVAGAAGVDEVSGLRVGDQPAPGPVGGELAGEGCGDDPVAGDLGGMLGEAEQGGEVDDDVDVDPVTVPGRHAGSGEVAAGPVEEGGAAAFRDGGLGHEGAVVVGPGVDRGLDDRRVRGGHRRV